MNINEFKKLHDKIESAERQTLVMVKPGGVVLRCYADTALAAKASAKHPDHVCGYYNNRISPDDLMDDLEFMGVTAE